MNGTAPLPTGDAELRAAFDARQLEELVEKLRILDPVEASRTALQNRRFVFRALEIRALTGMWASDLSDHWETRTREIKSPIAGEIDRATCEELINAATRQYA